MQHSLTNLLKLQFFIERGIPYDPECVFHDVRVRNISFVPGHISNES